MEMSHKKHYEAPQTEVFVIMQESVICTSPGSNQTEMNGAPSYNGFNTEETW